MTKNEQHFMPKRPTEPVLCERCKQPLKLETLVSRSGFQTFYSEDYVWPSVQHEPLECIANMLCEMINKDEPPE